MQFSTVLVGLAALAASGSAYELRCNGPPNALAIHDRTEAANKLVAMSGSSAIGGIYGHKLIDECGSTAPQCVRVTLYSEFGANVQDTKRNIGFAVQQISDACGQYGGSGPSLQNNNLVVHVSAEWV
jgi:hypothetical protein